HPFLNFEITYDAEVRQKIARPAEFIADRVAVVCVRCTGNQRRRKRSRREVRAARITLCAGHTRTRRPSLGDVEVRDKIRRLPGTVRVKVAAGSHGKRHTAHGTHHRVNQPAAQNRSSNTALKPWLTLSERQGNHAGELKVIGSV